MDAGLIIDILGEAVWIIFIMVSVIISPGLVLGFIISIFQAATQINEQTLSFVPKLLVTLITLWVLAPFLMGLITNYTYNLFVSIPDWIG